MDGVGDVVVHDAYEDFYLLALSAGDAHAARHVLVQVCLQLLFLDAEGGSTVLHHRLPVYGIGDGDGGQGLAQQAGVVPIVPHGTGREEGDFAPDVLEGVDYPPHRVVPLSVVDGEAAHFFHAVVVGLELCPVVSHAVHAVFARGLGREADDFLFVVVAHGEADVNGGVVEVFVEADCQLTPVFFANFEVEVVVAEADDARGLFGKGEALKVAFEVGGREVEAFVCRPGVAYAPVIGLEGDGDALSGPGEGDGRRPAGQEVVDKDSAVAGACQQQDDQAGRQRDEKSSAERWFRLMNGSHRMNQSVYVVTGRQR